MLRQKKAQSTLEYIIIFTFIVAAILLVANTTIKKKVENMLSHSAGQAEQAVNQIKFGNAVAGNARK